MPARAIDPGLTTQPVPACLDEHEAVPGELKGLVELIKDAPVNWFTHVPRILDGLNQLQDMHLALAGAKLQAERADGETSCRVAHERGVLERARANPHRPAPRCWPSKSPSRPASIWQGWPL